MNKTYYFWLGYLIHMAFVNGVQDIMGKTKYLRLADEMWVDTKPWYWIVMVVLFVGFGFVLEWFELQKRPWERK